MPDSTDETRSTRYSDDSGVYARGTPDELAIQVKALREAVMDMEWSSTWSRWGRSYLSCACCRRLATCYESCDFPDNYKPNIGHTAECPIAQALALSNPERK